MPGADWQAEIAILIEAVRAGGAVAKARHGQKLAIRQKADGSPVTDADEAVDAEIARVLRGARADYAWLSEESADPPAQRTHARAWIVDPIDGTRSFMKGADSYCQAACLTEYGRPMAAAIFCPPTGELFTAVRGGGAMLNGAPMRVAAPPSLADAIVLAGRAVFGAAAPFSVKPIKALCLALADVAAGRAHAVAALGPKSDWDLAAGALLVEEAGGQVCNADNTPFAFNRADPRQSGLLAAGPQLHALLSRRLAARGHDSLT